MNRSDVEEAFKAEFGRTPSQSEMAYFLKMGEGYGGAGQMSPYEMQQVVGATPEAQLRGLDRYTQMYQDKLGASDTFMLGKAQDQIAGQFRRMGRASSSGYVSAFADAAANLAAQRQNATAQFYGQGLGGVMSNKVGSGQNALERIQGQQDTQKQFERDYSLAQLNYFQQQNDFNNYMNAMNRRNKQSGLIGGLGSLAGAGLGIGLAAMAPGALPLQHALIAGGLGAGVGGNFSNMFR